MENQEIYYIEESQNWVCPMTGRWKIIAVGGGASGGKVYYYNNENTVTPTVAGNTTSFGTAIFAKGGPSTTAAPNKSDSQAVGGINGYGGYNGFEYHGDNMSAGAVGPVPKSGAMPTAAAGWGAGGGTSGIGQHVYAVPGRAGEIRTTIVTLGEGVNVPCTIGAGGQSETPSEMASGADGVIILQYLGV